MEGKRESRLASEASRDFQHQLLYNVVTGLKGMSLLEPENLAASFAPAHFELNENIGRVLRDTLQQ
jgi:hypothetical protein